MKNLLVIISIVLLASLAVSCHDNDNQTTWDEYADWRELNDAWLQEQMARKNPDGTPYYTRIVPAWNPSTFILMHFFNDRSLTEGNLTPLYTSVVDVRYVGRDCTGAGFDSSTLVTAYGPGIQRFACNGTIQGWSVALQNMRVGDTCDIVVPYGAAYVAATTGSIKPYSALQFNMRLVDIYSYEGR